MKLEKDPRKKYFSINFTQELPKLDETLNSRKSSKIPTTSSGGKIQTNRKTNKQKNRKKLTKACRVIRRNLILWVPIVTKLNGINS